jgi:putative SOS response-associated peptidase YedK
MCYNLVSGTKKLLQYARHRGQAADVTELEERLRRLGGALSPYYHVSGFSHPGLLVFTSDKPFEPRIFRWGLIPFWVKDQETARKIANQTINARSETMFEKPAFREPARKKRCLVYADAFYEHHHIQKRAYPFHISMKDKRPMAFAGLWDEWIDKETGEIISTVSIVTCRANTLLEKIHNNPDAEGPRMPVILPAELQDHWLNPPGNLQGQDLKNELFQLTIPYPEEQMEAYPVKRILGKEASGNVPEAEQPWMDAALRQNFNQW